MNHSEPDDIRAAIETLSRHVGCGVEQIQQAAAVAFAAVDPDRAHREADRLAKVLRAQELLTQFASVLQDLGLDPANGAPSSEEPRHRPVTGGGARLPDGPAMHREVLAEPILAALRQHGGTASLQQIWASVERQLGGRFTKSDLGGMPSHRNEPRWKYNVRWTLTDLKHEGKVEKTGARGVWRLR